MRAVWLSSTYYLDEAVQGLSANAERMLTRALAFCGNAETGGYLAEGSIALLGLPSPKKLVAELVAANILTPRQSGGWDFRKWPEWNSGADKLVARRKADRERQARRREQKSRDESRDTYVTEAPAESPDSTKNLEKRAGFSEYFRLAEASERVSRNEGLDRQNHSDQHNRESAHLSQHDVSRDMSRDNPAVEQNREESTSSYVGSSGTENNAREPRSAPIDADVWKLIRRTIPAEHPQAVRTELALQASALVKAGTGPELVVEALGLWLTKSVHPKVLPALVSELINTRNRPHANGTGTKSPPSERKVNAALELANRFANHPETQALEAR